MGPVVLKPWPPYALLMACEHAALSLQCRCGAVLLEARAVSPKVANRVVCHCSACRAFADRVDRSVLDEHGGTERFQVSPARLKILAGKEHLRCCQQNPGGALRWYTSCCGSAFGLMLAKSGTPFVALDCRRIVEVEAADALLGPVRARLNFAPPRRERRALKADFRSLIAMLWHLTPLIVRWWRRGDQKRSPFRDPKGVPIAPVERVYENTPRLARAAGCR